MECACTVPMDDPLELVDYLVYIDEVKKSRKEHQCTECDCTIKKDSWYMREVLSWNNALHVYKTCEDCWSIRQVFFSNGWYYGYIWNDMQSFVDECDGDISVECIRMLTPKARGRVLDMIEEIWVWRYSK